MTLDPKLAAAIAAAATASGALERDEARDLVGRPVRRARPPARSSPPQREAYARRVREAAAAAAARVPRPRSASARLAQRKAAEQIRRRERREQSARRRMLESELAAGTTCRPRDLEHWTWELGRVLMCAGRARLERELHALPVEYARRVRLAATRAGALESIHGRKTIAVAVLLWRLARPTRRLGMAALVEGLSRSMISRAIWCPTTGRGYGPEAIYQRSNPTCALDVYGPIPALVDSGALLAVQPPADCTSPIYVGPSGYALAQYWIGRACVRGAVPADTPAPS